MEDFTSKNITLAAPTTTLIKKGEGTLHTITVNKPVNTGTIAIYDGIDANGTLIGTITSGNALPYFLLYKRTFSVGLCIVTGTAAQDITVTYK